MHGDRIHEFDGLPGFTSHRQPLPDYLRFGRCGGREPHKVNPPPHASTDSEWCRYVLALDPCAYCGGVVEAIDHIQPLSRGGTNDWTNFVGACRRCNFTKHATPFLSFMRKRTAA